MPYISQEAREELEQPLGILEQFQRDRPGELNYLITRLVKNYLLLRFVRSGNVGYSDMNEVMGVLSSAAAEFYRRKMVPYEDAKIQENGDVY